MDIKLIPKEYKKQQTETSAELKLPFSDKPVKSKLILGLWERMNMWLIITLALVVFSILLGGLLFIYKDYLNNQLNDLEQELAVLENQRDRELEAKVEDLGIAIEMLKTLLDDHVYPTKLFQLLVETTVAKVQYIDFNADLSKESLSLQGKAADYRTLAQQMKVYFEDSRIADLATSDIRLDRQGNVAFRIKLTIDPSYLKYHPDQDEKN